METKTPTAVQYLIESLQSGDFSAYNRHHIKKVMDMEREQILNAYWAGLHGSINDYSKAVINEKTGIMSGIIEGGAAERYYQQAMSVRGYVITRETEGVKYYSMRDRKSWTNKIELSAIYSHIPDFDWIDQSMMIELI